MFLKLHVSPTERFLTSPRIWLRVVRNSGAVSRCRNGLQFSHQILDAKCASVELMLLACAPWLHPSRSSRVLPPQNSSTRANSPAFCCLCRQHLTDPEQNRPWNRFGTKPVSRSICGLHRFGTGLGPNRFQNRFGGQTGLTKPVLKPVWPNRFRNRFGQTGLDLKPVPDRFGPKPVLKPV
jgi:hypothetical protein